MAHRSYILSYHDSLIRQEDYDLLTGRHWLNDVLIEFCLEYFQNDAYESLSSRFSYLGPSVTQLIKMGDEDLGESIINSMCLTQKELVLIALNDETSIERSGGTHWSLMVYYPATQKIEHYDSVQAGGNDRIARDFTAKLKKAGLPIKTGMVPCNCLQQSDSYNCGIHLLVNAEAIIKMVLLNDENTLDNLADPMAVQTMRKRIKEFIDSNK